MEDRLQQILESSRSGKICVLTGAGISAESGIPTFRGKEGYWVVGSRNYMPQEMATARMFTRQPEEVWRWYLYRFGLCRKFEPNPAHRALAQLEHSIDDRFRLVTQNIDGLHLRAGNSPQRTYAIHGDSTWMRCSGDCSGLVALPDFGQRDVTTPLGANERERLTCPKCNQWMRPHVLWFDECYDEPLYRAESALRAAAEADLLIVVGTSGATNLPSQIGALCFRLGTPMIDVNPEPNPFSELAARGRAGGALRGPASELVPSIVEVLIHP
ncbi:MAG TPA: Sir2 family NAD-dependent protein deacetylase [Polyangiaceae bacterium]|nr:Sir2 family NAD-dependent protein deacetylase [Polyangiaceae bacterium]